MFKKLVVILLSILFLTACSKKEPEPEFMIPDGWVGPTSGPLPSEVAPDSPPNEAMPAEDLAN